jgi:NAD(P)-dependent dehydrogenase (short-subunit alcohol dehydrogenase family)
MGRPETIEETGELIAAAGGAGSALVVDHEDPASVAELVGGIERDQGRLDVLVNDIFGGDKYMEWDKPVWEHDWAGGLRMLQMGVHTHLINCRAAIPLMLKSADDQRPRGLVVEMTDGTSDANAEFRRNVGFYYDLVKANVERIVKGLDAELGGLPVTAVGVTPGWLRSEKMLENFGVTEANWRDAVEKRPGFGISESPTYVARGVAALAEADDADRWAGTIVSARQLADAYDFTDTDGRKLRQAAIHRELQEFLGQHARDIAVKLLQALIEHVAAVGTEVAFDLGVVIVRLPPLVDACQHRGGTGAQRRPGEAAGFLFGDPKDALGRDDVLDAVRGAAGQERRRAGAGHPPAPHRSPRRNDPADADPSRHAIRGRSRACSSWATASSSPADADASTGSRVPPSTATDAYGVRPMNASSLVWTSASSGTWTRGPYWPLCRNASSIGSMPSSIAAHLSGSSVSSWPVARAKWSICS